MECICYVLLGYGLGVFTFLFILGWLDEREDAFCNIKFKTNLDTCIDWTLRLESLKVKSIPLQSKPKRISMEKYRSSLYWYRKNVLRISYIP